MTDRDRSATFVERVRSLCAALGRLDRRRPWLFPAITFVAAIVLYARRRPDQLAHPMVWAEETVILGRWFTSHSSALVDPVAGQSVLVSSWLVSLAGAISLRHLPTIEVGLMLLVFAATLLLLILPDSVWGPRWVRCLMALALALVPANPEPYMVLLFAFWWTSLWPLLVLGWRRDHYVIRIAVLIVAGLSSLAASFAAPLFFVLWLWRRQRRDLISAIVLAPCLVLQLEVVRTSPRVYPTFDLQSVVMQMGRDVAYLFRDVPLGVIPQNDSIEAWGVEVLLITGLIIAIIRLPQARSRAAGFILLLGVAGYAALSAIPAPLQTNPSGDGPRYYFLPYALIALLLLFLIGASRDRIVRIACGIALLLALVPLRHDYARQADPVDWGAAVAECAASSAPTYRLPVQADGQVESLWGLVVSTAICRSAR